MTAVKIVEVGRVGAKVAGAGAVVNRRRGRRQEVRQVRRAAKVAAAHRRGAWFTLADVVRKVAKGVAVAVAAWARWTFDLEHFLDVRTARQAAREAPTTAEKKQSMMVVDRFRRRAAVSVSIHAGSGLAVAALLYFAGWFMVNHRPVLLPGAYILVGLALYYLGDMIDGEATTSPPMAVDMRDLPITTAGAVIEALRAAIPKLDTLYTRLHKAAADDPASFQPPIATPRVRETADGAEHCDVRLPKGFKIGQIDLELFAGALGKGETEVFVRKGSTPSDVAVTILPGPLSAMPAPVWPHLEQPFIDVFAGVHIGVNPARRPVIVDIAETSTAVTGMPRTGKTDLLRKLAAAHAKVPHSMLAVVNGKANGDFLPVEALATVAIIGAEKSDQKMLADTLAHFSDVIKQRNAVIRDYATEAPNQKLNPWLVDNLGWGTICVVIDEANLFTKGPYAAAILDRLSYVAEKGPSVGGSIIIGSQRFSASTMAQEILAMCGNVAAFKLDSHIETGMAFGGSWAGPKPHLFGSEDDDSADLAAAKAQGVCAIKGALSGGKLVRCSETTIATLAPSLDATRAAKSDAGQLSGHSVGQVVVTAVPDSDIGLDTDRSGLLQRVATLCPDVDVIATEELLARLVDRWPDDYTGMTVTKLGRDLSQRYGLEKTIDGDGRRAYNIAPAKVEVDRVAA